MRAVSAGGAENEGVVGAFVGERTDATVVSFTLPVGQAAAIGWQILPGDGDLDGMYYALLRKTG